MPGILTFQVILTGSAQQVPSNPIQGKPLTISNPTGNGDVTISTSATNGSNGFILPAGAVVTLEGLTDTDAIWVNGTSTQKVSGIASL